MYRPTERDRYQAESSTLAEAWDKLDEALPTPPSLEVFRHGRHKAVSYMGRSVSVDEYANWLIEWYESNPDSMKEAP